MSAYSLLGIVLSADTIKEKINTPDACPNGTYV